MIDGNCYKVSVKGLDIIDVYDVLALYGVESHAVGHAVKKLLCAGGRGAKPVLQDLREAIGSIERAIEIEERGVAGHDARVVVGAQTIAVAPKKRGRPKAVKK